MPLYVWQCTECKTQVELLRSFDEYRRGPEVAELTGPDGDDSAARCKGQKGKGRFHTFDKLILPPKVAFGESWSPDGRGMKGRH